MLNALRQSAQGVFAKIILAMLVGSFVLWGIGDIFRQGGGGGSVATIGKSKISIQEYQVALQQKQEQMREMMGKAYNPDMLKRMGLGEQVLFNLVNHEAVKLEAQAQGIVISDDAVRAGIAANPSFQNQDGVFDKEAYTSILHNSGISEAHFIASERDEQATKLLTATIGSRLAVPDDLVRALYHVRGEQRTASLLLITHGDTQTAPQPTEADLKQWYDAHTQEFAVPESRSVSYVLLSASDVQSHIDVPEAEIKQAYQEHLPEFHLPERRVIDQMLFGKEADAKQAAIDLAKGQDFAKVAAHAPIVNKNKLSLGEQSKAQLPQEAQDIVFGLKEGQVSPPIQTAFGWHIFHVARIEPEGTAPLDAVRANLTKELAGRNVQDVMNRQVAKLEDALAGGASLKDAAQKIGQSVVAAGPFNRQGMSADNQKLPLPTYENFIPTVFATALHDHSQAVPANDGSYFVVEVTNMTPERVRPLGEAHDEALKRWQAEAKQKAFQTTANQAADALRKGGDATSLLQAQHLASSVVASGPLLRASETSTAPKLAGVALPQAFLRELFSLGKPGAATHAYLLANGDALIGTLQSVQPATDASMNSDEGKKTIAAIRAELGESLEQDMLHDYLAYLRDKYHASYNRSALPADDQAN